MYPNLICLIILWFVSFCWFSSQGRRVFYLGSDGAVISSTWWELKRLDVPVIFILQVDETEAYGIETYRCGSLRDHQVQWLGWEVTGYAEAGRLRVRDWIGDLANDVSVQEILRRAQHKVGHVIGAR